MITFFQFPVESPFAIVKFSNDYLLGEAKNAVTALKCPNIELNQKH